MKNLVKAVSIAIVAVAPLASAIQSAQARDGIVEQTTRINYKGFQKCKALGGSGYQLSASGFSFDGPGGGNFSGGGYQFRVKTCFETSAQCQSFINRIHHHISSIERVYHANCTSRG